MPREVKGFLPITRMSIDRKVATTGQGWGYEADQDVERRLTGGLRFGLKPHPPMADGQVYEMGNTRKLFSG